jgi:cytoskeletal protein RodZ
MATIPPPEETAKIILEAAVAGNSGMRPGEVRKHFTLRAGALERGVHMEDFSPGLAHAVDKGWFELADSGFFRLTEGGFAVASSPPAIAQQPVPGHGGTPGADTVNVSSHGQSAGITAQEIHFHGPTNIHGSTSTHTAKSPRSPWWKSWWAVVLGVATIIAGVVPLLEYLHIDWPWRHEQVKAQTQRISQSAPVVQQPPKQEEPSQPLPATQSAPLGQAKGEPRKLRHHPVRAEASTASQPTAAISSGPTVSHPPPAEQTPIQQQANVSSQNQSGGITAGTVNVYGPKQQRHLDQQGVDFLTQHISKTGKVTVTAVMGDSEALVYAQEITNWLRANGWTNVDGVNQAIFSGPVFGQGVSPNKDGGFDIQIGNQR